VRRANCARDDAALPFACDSGLHRPLGFSLPLKHLRAAYPATHTFFSASMFLPLFRSLTRGLASPVVNLPPSSVLGAKCVPTPSFPDYPFPPHSLETKLSRRAPLEGKQNALPLFIAFHVLTCLNASSFFPFSGSLVLPKMIPDFSARPSPPWRPHGLSISRTRVYKALSCWLPTQVAAL